MAKAPNKVEGERALYQLNKTYWDGERAHAPGDRVWFDPGKAPRTAKRVQEPELPSSGVGTLAGEGQD